MREKIKQLREHLGLNRTEFAEVTGVPSKTWSNIENGLQKANEDHLQAIAKHWPEYSYWLLTGNTIPEAGQISPELDEAREKLLKVG